MLKISECSQTGPLLLEVNPKTFSSLIQSLTFNSCYLQHNMIPSTRHTSLFLRYGKVIKATQEREARPAAELIYSLTCRGKDPAMEELWGGEMAEVLTERWWHHAQHWPTLPSVTQAGPHEHSIVPLSLKGAVNPLASCLSLTEYQVTEVPSGFRRSVD